MYYLHDLKHIFLHGIGRVALEDFWLPLVERHDMVIPDIPHSVVKETV